MDIILRLMRRPNIKEPILIPAYVSALIYVSCEFNFNFYFLNFNSEQD